MEAVSQQVAWLIKNPPQPVAPTINWKLVQTALQLVYEQVRGMRTETNLIPIHSALNELSINEVISTVACGLHSGGSIRSVRDRLKVDLSTFHRAAVRPRLGYLSVRRGLMRC